MQTRYGIAALLLSLIVPRPILAANQTTARYAIVLGNNRSERSTVPNLRYADDDALAVHQLLLQAGVDSVLLANLDENTKNLNPTIEPDGRPSEKDVDRLFAAVSAKIQSDTKRGIATELLLFYSGHGDMVDGEGYAVLEGGRLTRTKLHSFLSSNTATRNHVIVDACKSYYLAFDKGPGGRREPYARSFVGSAAAKLYNTGFVLSSSSDRESHEWERLQSGILSHEVRSALRGAADTNRDGSITYAELGAFIRRANQEIPNPSFKPDVMVLPPGKDLEQEVLRWKPGTAVVQLYGSNLGHVYVENARGARILDAHPAEQQPLALRVPDERPLFVRRHDGTAEYVVENRDPVVVATLQQTPQIAAKGALHLAFERLFELPFAQQVVADFEQDARADLAVRDTGMQSTASITWKEVSRWSGAIALGAGIGALGLGLMTAERYYGEPGASNLNADHRFSVGRDLRIGAIVLGSIAGAAGLTWGATQLWPEVTVGANGQGTTMSLSGRF